MSEPRIEPRHVIEEIEQYVRAELTDAEKYSNREILDESGVRSLHALAARIYAFGYDDGERSEATRASARDGRLRDQHRAELKAAREAVDAERGHP